MQSSKGLFCYDWKLFDHRCVNVKFIFILETLIVSSRITHSHLYEFMTPYKIREKSVYIKEMGFSVSNYNAAKIIKNKKILASWYKAWAIWYLRFCSPTQVDAPVWSEMRGSPSISSECKLQAPSHTFPDPSPYQTKYYLESYHFVSKATEVHKQLCHRA